MKKLRVGDNVKVIAGNDKGKMGLVKTIDSKKGKVLVEGINLKFKHIKPSQSKDEGSIKQIEAPIAISNVNLCDENGKVIRVGFKEEGAKRVRINKKTNQTI
uniref:ribosomal protein L24 n=1 Tax=Meringosphaera mediterranea TaxID=2837474 RepID=UPI00286CEBA3|nr:ribosomal protein L24 [Meringosphaera mediterranea]WLD05722.1 ribosomal protein L24 [Meringosphaera mediterranea]WLD05868.1 ribosomal protein L24 [Meringosphaera mediterranea]WLD06088.1 ribosomal protein L24 [Meringosphaera mediterranea]